MWKAAFVTMHIFTGYEGGEHIKVNVSPQMCFHLQAAAYEGMKQYEDKTRPFHAWVHCEYKITGEEL